MTAPASISVVVPCYNAERWIASTLRSVLAQDWPGLEIIVVDDGSCDGSATVVAREFPQVTLVRQPNAGVAAARNCGIERARGDWVAFVDADDIWLPGKLRAQWRALAALPEARMACSGWQVWPSSQPEPAPALLATLAAQAGDAKRWGGPSGWIYPQLLLSCQVWTSTVLMQRALLAEIGGFDTGLRIGEDYDLWLRASRATPILRVAQPLALYRKHPDSITRSAPLANYQAAVVERALARWGYTSPDGRAARKADVQRALAATWCDFAGAHLAAGNPQRARDGAVRALRMRWRQLAGWKLLVKSLVHSGGAAATRP